MALRVASLTVSDSASRGEREDKSGDAIASWVSAAGHELARRAVVPDETVAIVRHLIEWCDADVVDVVLTTGGTGLSGRDVTPEATRAVIEREAPGIAERLRASGAVREPRAVLSRGVSGVRGQVLVVNLPGSPRAVREGISVLAPILEHAVRILRGKPHGHEE
jgi:molybdopterin adenylyltransferase